MDKIRYFTWYDFWKIIGTMFIFAVPRFLPMLPIVQLTFSGIFLAACIYIDRKFLDESYAGFQ